MIVVLTAIWRSRRHQTVYPPEKGTSLKQIREYNDVSREYNSRRAYHLARSPDMIVNKPFDVGKATHGNTGC